MTQQKLLEKKTTIVQPVANVARAQSVQQTPSGPSKNEKLDIINNRQSK